MRTQIIQQCREADLEVLARQNPSPAHVRWNEERFQRHQQGLTTFLIAWVDDTPAGAGEIRWQGCAAPEVHGRFPDCPEINGLAVWPPERRSHGIGTAIVRTAEDLAVQTGYRWIGLGVDDQNTRAATLYLRLGYQETGCRYLDRYHYVDDNGIRHDAADRCRFLIKPLAATPAARSNPSLGMTWLQTASKSGPWRAGARNGPPAGQTDIVAVELANADVAERLEAFAVLLDLAEASPYATRAYRRAAEMIRETPAPVAELVRSGRSEELRGIGPGIAARLQELVETGTIAELDELKRVVKPELAGFGRLLGIAPKRMVEIAAQLDLETPADFRRAARGGSLRQVRGIGPATERRILERLEADRSRPARGLQLRRARRLAEGVADALGGTVAGDARRWAELSFDLSVVVPSEQPDDVVRAFERLPQVVAIVERGERRVVGVTVEGVPVMLHVPEPHRFGAELVRRTGAKDYVEALGPLPDALDEAAVYDALDVPWCPPELREAPFGGQPPILLELADVRGDLHCHTTWSDGKASVMEMAVAARDRGYEYVAICDHTPNVRVVPGLDADALRRQADEIAEANDALAPFRVLRGVEVDILRDGSLDLPDDVLAELDWVQLSLHAGQREPRAALTAKVAEAMLHPAVRCLSHPTGRILNHRAPNALDLETVFEIAVEHGIAVEVNGLPDRLDLSGSNTRLAVEAGVAVVVSTDAHSIRGLDNMELAVATARRGWATGADVLNTRPLDAVLSHRAR